MAKQSPSTVSIPASLVPEFEAWGKLTVRLFGELRRRVGLKPQNVPPDQAWFWTEKWQEGERAVDQALARGDYRDFSSVDELIRELLGHFIKPVESAYRTGTDYLATEAYIKYLPNCIFVTNAAAKFDFQVNGFCDSLNRVDIDGFADAGAVQINDMQPLGTGGKKLSGLIEGVIFVHDLPVILTLDEPDTFATSQVNRWYYIHTDLAFIRTKNEFTRF